MGPENASFADDESARNELAVTRASEEVIDGWLAYECARLRFIAQFALDERYSTDNRTRVHHDLESRRHPDLTSTDEFPSVTE